MLLLRDLPPSVVRIDNAREFRVPLMKKNALLPPSSSGTPDCSEEPRELHEDGVI